MDIDVAMPWRPTPDRIPAFEHVTAWWAGNGYRVILGDSDPTLPFNVSAARNTAVQQATTDVVIVADADTIPDPAALETAIYACQRHGGVWWPFTEYRYLAPSVQPGDDLTTALTEHIYPNSVGGLLVIRRDDYSRLGGFDEQRFTSWGYEDVAFRIVAESLSSIHRVPGVVYAFNHQADRNMRGPGRRAIDEYRQAARTGRLHELISTNR